MCGPCRCWQVLPGKISEIFVIGTVREHKYHRAFRRLWIAVGDADFPFAPFGVSVCMCVHTHAHSVVVHMVVLVCLVAYFISVHLIPLRQGVH